jgi:hypothetical protein
MTFRLFADSFGDGSGASTPANAYASLIANDLAVTIVNASHGGDMWADQAEEVYAAVVVDGDTSLIELGCNDQRIYGTDLTKRGYYLKGIAAHIGWLGCSNKIRARDTAAIETGSWEDTGAYFGVQAHGRCGLAVGATKTFTVNGYVAYLCHLAQDGQGGAFEVKIDGVSKGTFQTNAPGMTTYNGRGYGPQLLRFGSLGPGQHTVQVTQTQAGRAYIEWATGSSDQTFRPKVFVANITRSGTYQWGGSEANVTAYNADLQVLVNEFIQQGFAVTLVDINSAVDPLLDLAGDSLHPDDSGHRKIADAFVNAIGPLTYTTATVQVRSDGRIFANGIELARA